MQSKSLSVVSSLLYSGYSDNNINNNKKKKMAAGTSSFRKTAQATSHQQQQQKQKHQKNDISRTQLLNDGNVIPTLGLGTWKSNPPEECTLAITSALRNGLTHLDCASAYANEHVIGKCLSKVFGNEDTSREDVFITSKLWNDRRKPDDVREALEQTLEDLQLEYIDLYLIHWPVCWKRGTVLVDDTETSIEEEDMEELRALDCDYSTAPAPWSHFPQVARRNKILRPLFKVLTYPFFKVFSMDVQMMGRKKFITFGATRR
jgi:hypothetical protein